MKITVSELQEVLRLHEMYLNHEDCGVRADLSDADLSAADLSGANLSGANLSGIIYNELTAFFCSTSSRRRFIYWF